MALSDDGAAGAGSGASGAGSASDLLGGAAAAADAGAGGGAAADGAGRGEQGAGGDAGGSDGITGGADPDWYSQISADVADGEKASLRDWVKSVQAKDIGDLAKIARDNQLALRESGRIKVPGEGATPEEVKAFHKATGVPDDAKGYELPVVKGPDGHDVKLDDGILGRLSESALKYGIPKAAYQGLINDFVGLQLDQVAHGDVEQQQLADKWVKEQGANLNARTAAINSALSSLGLSGEDAKAIRCAIGADRALAMFAKLGEGMQEDVMITGGKGRFGIDGAAAQAEIDKLKTDSAWLGKAMQPGTPENMRYNRLNEAAGEWEARKRAAA